MNWIPCAERLPEGESAVLVVCRGTLPKPHLYVCEAYFIIMPDGKAVWDSWDGHASEPLYWMPLPAPPEVEP